MFERYSELARQAIFFARINAGEAGATSIDIRHLITGVLTVDAELPINFGLGIDSAFILKKLEDSPQSGPAVATNVDLPTTRSLRKVLERATSLADLQQCREIRTEHLFVSAFELGDTAIEFIADLRIDKQAMVDLLSKVDCSQSQKGTDESRQALARKLPY
jgi:ATP-dependent Clp protease ATP-binding subunit ClpA